MKRHHDRLLRRILMTSVMLVALLVCGFVVRIPSLSHTVAAQEQPPTPPDLPDAPPGPTLPSGPPPPMPPNEIPTLPPVATPIPATQIPDDPPSAATTVVPPPTSTPAPGTPTAVPGTPTALPTLPPVVTPLPVTPLPTDLPSTVTPVVPLPTTTRTPQLDPAQLSLTLITSPNTSVVAGGQVVLEMIVVNRGRGAARDFRISLPLEGMPLRVLDVQATEATTWVSEHQPDRLIIRGGSVAARDTVRITVRLRVAEDAVPGTALGSRATISWSDWADGGQAQSNLPILVVSTQTVNQETFSFAQERLRPGDQATAAYFIPGESVALWYQPVNGDAIAAGRVIADQNGMITVLISSDNLPHGQITLVAFGIWSTITVTGTIVVP